MTEATKDPVENLERKLMGKLDTLSADVETKVLEKIRTETKEWLSELKKDMKERREVTPATGGVPDRFSNLKALFSLPKLDVAIPDLSAAYKDFQSNDVMKGWSSDYMRGLAGFAKAAYLREHNQLLGSDVIKAMGETQGGTGGFFVPIEYRSELLRLVIESQVVRPRATIVPMQTDLLRIPKIVDTSHVSGIHGGIAGTFGAEAAALGTGDPAAGQIELKAKKFSDYILVSNELVMDSPIAIAPLLGVLMREGLGFFEDASALWGTGANAMAGILNTATNPAMIATARDTSGTITYEDVKNMFARMFPSSLNRAVWIASPSVFPALASMAVTVGTGGSAVWISNYNTAVGAPPATIFGRPVIFSEKLSQLGTAGDIAFCDFSYYLIGDRMEMALTTSEHVAFATDQTAFRIIERLDGAPWIASALTPYKQTDTLSAFVSVAT